MNAPTAAGSQLPAFISNDANATAAAGTSANSADRAAFADLLQGSRDETSPAAAGSTLPQSKPAIEPATDEESGTTDPVLATPLPALTTPAAKTEANDHGIDNILAQAALAGALVSPPLQAEHPAQGDSDHGGSAQDGIFNAMIGATQKTQVATVGLNEEGLHRIPGVGPQNIDDAPFAATATSISPPFQAEHRPASAALSSLPLESMTTITPDDSANAQLVANGSATHNDTDGTAAPSMPPLMIAESVASTRLGNVAATAPAIDNAPLLPDALAMDADFDDGLGQRIEWMAREGIGQARLKLTPEGMGQISIQLNLDGNRLDAQFQASHSQVRHALNASLDHLREMLREQGMQLGNTHVGQQAQGGASGEREPAQATQAAASGNDPADDGVADAQSPAPRWQGSTSHLLDTWA